MKKKQKIIISEQFMRDEGFKDGFLGEKKRINSFIELLVKKKKYSKEEIINYLEAYNKGYVKGYFTQNHLSELKTNKDTLIYNGKPIEEYNKLNIEVIEETIIEKQQSLQKKKR